MSYRGKPQGLVWGIYLAQGDAQIVSFALGGRHSTQDDVQCHEVGKHRYDYRQLDLRE